MKGSTEVFVSAVHTGSTVYQYLCHLIVAIGHRQHQWCPSGGGGWVEEEEEEEKEEEEEEEEEDEEKEKEKEGWCPVNGVCV